jgi:hypothetical protein
MFSLFRKAFIEGIDLFETATLLHALLLSLPAGIRAGAQLAISSPINTRGPRGNASKRFGNLIGCQGTAELGHSGFLLRTLGVECGQYPLFRIML